MKFSIFFVLFIKLALCARVEVTNDEVVIEAIRENRNLIILFTKKDCVECKYEQSLAAMRDELESSLDAKVWKLESSQLQRVYDYQKQDSSLIFIRKGVGLIYPSDEPDTADDIFEFFSDNREPVVKELEDTNFEHLTQASTGSTTGDWFIQFYDSQCLECNRLASVWETVGAKLKRRMNVARVNRATKGVLTSKRFKVEQVPEFILIRSGKFYRYNLKKYDVESFVGFSTSWFNRVAAEKVKTPATPFEDLLDFIVVTLRGFSPNVISENPTVVLAIILAVFVILALICCRRNQPFEADTQPIIIKKDQ